MGIRWIGGGPRRTSPPRPDNLRKIGVWVSFEQGYRPRGSSWRRCSIPAHNSCQADIFLLQAVLMMINCSCGFFFAHLSLTGHTLFSDRDTRGLFLAMIFNYSILFQVLV